MKRRPYLQRLPRAHFYVYDPNGIDYYQIRCQAPGVYYLLFFEGSVYYVLYGIFIYYVFYLYYALEFSHGIAILSMLRILPLRDHLGMGTFSPNPSSID